MMKYAIVHEWFDGPAGSEQVVRSFLNVWPDSDVFTLVDFFSDADRDFILKGKHPKTTFIQDLPFAKSRFRMYLPLFPLAIEQCDVSPYDVVISSAHAVAKGVITKISQMHISYCHSPMRYAWDLYHQYMRESGYDKKLIGWYAKMFLHRLRIWDATTANRVDYFIGNSEYTARRIRKTYNRPADVIYPPVETESFPCETNKDDYYITVSRLVPYKKIDLIVEAFAQMPDKKLLVIGDGTEMQKVKAAAAKNIQMLGHIPNAELKKYMAKAKAFVFAAEEDFGIVVIEAMACGTPVIALNKGGTAETVKHLQTGILFNEQTAESITGAVNLFEKEQDRFDPSAVSEYASGFSRASFEEAMKNYVNAKAEKFF